MAVGYNPRAVTDGLVLALDAGNPKNYNAGISTNWTDKIGGNNGTLVGGTHHNDGPFVGAGYVEFDGTGDTLTLSNTADHQFGSSDYTIESWVYLNNLSTVQGLFGRYNTSSAREIYITFNTNGSITHRTSSNGTSFSTHSTSAGLLTANTWHHVAISKSGTTSYIAVDGVVVTGTVDATLHSASQTTYIGDALAGSNLLNGNLSNYRILKGTALYTSNFTPPTGPLTAVTNTVLLTCQGNTIADASSSAHTITANGDISLTKEPFAGAGAVDFGGSADGLYTPNITLGSNDWTLEFWIYLTSTGTARGLYSYMLGNTPDRQISYSIDSSNQIGWQHRLNDGTYPSATGSTALSAHTWYHVAAVRVNDDYYTYINGVQDSSYTSAPAGHTYYADGVPHYIGYNRTGTSDFDGLLSNVRFVNGTALYTSNFTPPAEPLTAVTNTELLTCQGQNIKDASSNSHAITVNGDAKATIVSSAFEFDGSDDYILLDNGLGIGTDDFAISVWVKFDSVSGVSGSANYRTVLSSYSGGLGYIFGLWISGNPVFEHYMDGTSYKGNTTIVAGTWYNMVSTRLSGDLYLYLNGSLDNTPVSASTKDMADTATPRIGWIPSASQNGRLDGTVSDLKIYKGKGLTAAEVTQNYNATKGRYA